MCYLLDMTYVIDWYRYNTCLSYSWWLVKWNCWWFFQYNVWKWRTISLIREIGLTSLKFIAIKIVVSSEWFRVTVFECRENSADHNGGQPGSNWTSQIWKAAHCLGVHHCLWGLHLWYFTSWYKYDMFLWLKGQIVHFPYYIGIAARWKEIYKLFLAGYNKQAFCRYAVMINTLRQKRFA